MAYYMGDYYRGDPGLFGFLKKAAGTVLGVVSKVVPGPIGVAARLGSSVLAGRAPSLPAAAGQFLPSMIPQALPVIQALGVQTAGSLPTATVGTPPAVAQLQKAPQRSKAIRRRTSARTARRRANTATRSRLRRRGYRV